MPDEFEIDHEGRYYNAWYYGAVHVLLSIPEFQNREAIAKNFFVFS